MSTTNLKKVPFWERAFAAGKIIGVNGYSVNQALLEQRVIEGGYQVLQTPHFMVCRQAKFPTIVVHRFAPGAIDADLGHFFLEELKPLGVLARPEDFGDVFGAIVGSLFPGDPHRAWYLFGTNTLRRYQHLLTTHSNPSQDGSPINIFATLYRRVCELVVGDSILDAGCSFGFFSLIAALRIASLAQVVGVDIRADPFPVTRALAAERQLVNVQFTQADLLADGFSVIGQFDTVTALHVLEHFSETDMYRALTNLLKVVKRRLVIAVPYEPGELESAYGHKQLFSRAKLEAIGQWCLEHLGRGGVTCEDCVGGLLFVDRHPSGQ